MAVENGINGFPVANCVGVHMVGSVNYPTTEEVFTALAKALPRHLQRMPDGEPGKRNYFVLFQQEFFAAAPQVNRQYDASFNTVEIPPPTQDEIDAAIKALEASPLSTQYDSAAIESYQLFKSLQDAGTIPNDVRFQVSLPMPASVMSIVAQGYQAAVEPLYEKHLIKAIRNIEAAIPHDKLTIQFDIAAEFAYLEGDNLWPHFNQWFSPVREGIKERAVRIAGQVSPDIELGFHLCYGDVGHKHFVEPKDMANLVDIANGIQAGAGRSFDYVHMPVPLDRDDLAYFEPLKELSKQFGHLYLGLIHPHDLKGTKRRIATAVEVLEGRKFGVAAECGLGRWAPEDLNSMYEIGAAVSSPVIGLENGA